MMTIHKMESPSLRAVNPQIYPVKVTPESTLDPDGEVYWWNQNPLSPFRAPLKCLSKLDGAAILLQGATSLTIEVV